MSINEWRAALLRGYDPIYTRSPPSYTNAKLPTNGRQHQRKKTAPHTSEESCPGPSRRQARSRCSDSLLTTPGRQLAETANSTGPADPDNPVINMLEFLINNENSLFISYI